MMEETFFEEYEQTKDFLIGNISNRSTISSIPNRSYHNNSMKEDNKWPIMLFGTTKEQNFGH
jgi:hypothetical protein